MPTRPNTWETVLPKLLARADVGGSDECWNWTGAKANGYGLMVFNPTREPLGRKTRTAHALMWEIHNQAMMLPGYVVEHLCMNAACINPAHLAPATHETNLLRPDGMVGIKKWRTHCLRGHLLAGDNLVPRSNGRRMCRECNLAATRRWNERKREAA